MVDFDENEIHYEIYFHLVWSTKNQNPIISKNFSKQLYQFIADQSLENQCFVILANGAPDHIQLVIKFNPEISLDRFVNDIKMASRMWIRANFYQDFDWQESYCSFTVGPEEIEMLVNKFVSLRPFAEEVFPILDACEISYQKHEVLE